jgi:hypothetical protein
MCGEEATEAVIPNEQSEKANRVRQSQNETEQDVSGSKTGSNVVKIYLRIIYHPGKDSHEWQSQKSIPIVPKVH